MSGAEVHAVHWIRHFYIYKIVFFKQKNTFSVTVEKTLKKKILTKAFMIHASAG